MRVSIWVGCCCMDSLYFLAGFGGGVGGCVV